MRMVRYILLYIVLAFGAAGAAAQSVHWEPARGTLAVGQATALGLIYDGCEPKGTAQPALPKVDGLTLQFYGRSENTSMVNFSFSRTVTLTYAALLSKKQPVDIPAFDVETDKGRLHVASAHFDPTGATVGPSGTPLETAASAKLVPSPSTVWAGEVFELTSTVEAARSYFPTFQRTFDWAAEPLLAEAWSSPEQIEVANPSEPHAGIVSRTRAIARTPGTLKLNPATHLVNLSVGVSGFGFFQQRQYDQYSVSSNSPTLTVKPLPTPPAGFSGAVGQFKLVSKVVPASAAVGEPVTWTLELTGSGNWPDISGFPAREVSRDFNVVQPKAKRTPAEGKLFDGSLTEDVVLVPTQPGSYILGPIALSYFDPKAGIYKTLTAPRTAVTITAPEATKFAVNPPAPANSPGNPPEESTPSTRGISRAIAPVPTLPSGLPRDPLPLQGEVATPLGKGTLVVSVLAPFIITLGAWLALAWKRARKTDPALARREAEHRLEATLARLEKVPPAQRPDALLAWQHDSARLWQISHAAPGGEVFRDASWTQLWEESDRALYGTTRELPADWVARARAAVKSKGAPRFSAAQIFLPRNLAPFILSLLVALVVLATALRAEDGATLYAQADFPGAEKAWRKNLESAPADASARHNLSLALAQQDRWEAAAAEATAAFVQRPGDPSIRWQFSLACEKAGFTPAPLVGFLQPGEWNLLVARASAPDWQRYMIAAAALLALALIALLVNAYGPHARSTLVAASAVGVFALIGGVTALQAARTYGLGANREAAIVQHTGVLRSIPTEADTAQKTTPLAAGSVGLVNGEYLGWVRLSFENGQTGWVRRDEVVTLWK